MVMPYKLNAEEVSAAVRRNNNVENIIKEQYLISKDIDYLLKNKICLKSLYISHGLTEKQIDKAIKIGEYLEELVKYQYLTQKQILRINKINVLLFFSTVNHQRYSPDTIKSEIVRAVFMYKSKDYKNDGLVILEMFIINQKLFPHQRKILIDAKLALKKILDFQYITKQEKIKIQFLLASSKKKNK